MGAARRDGTDESAMFLRDEVPEQRIVMGVACRTVEIVDGGVSFHTIYGSSERHCGAVGELPMRAVGYENASDLGGVCYERVADDSTSATPSGAVLVGMIIQSDVISKIEAL